MPLSDRRDRFELLKNVSVAGRELEIENVWWHQDRLILKFRGIDNISDAEPLSGADVQVSPDQRIATEADEYFLSDLVGCAVITAAGDAIGTVEGWDETGGPVLLRVQPGDGRQELLVPFARAICTDVDIAGKRIVVNLPEGLADVNAT